LAHFLQKDSVKQWLEQNAVGQTMPNMNTEILRELPLISASSRKEEEKIALILSTWDKVIETVEKLVANSQQQKKALMQQLLTAQKRLLDDNGVKFGDEWEEKSIKSILTISKGQQLNRDTLNTTSVYPVINGGIVPSGYTDDFNTNANTITISEGGNSCGYVSFQKTDFWCGGHCYALKKLKLNLEFTYHLLKFNEIQIMRLRVGSGLPNIQKKDLENLQVSFPTNSHEQEKIAQVLMLADREIDLYQQQLDKLKLEKKALMQQLLTGQKRVKLNNQKTA
jgi:type I restriction enzyme S subunit